MKKGPLVWMDMDQVELDAAYDQNVYAPDDRPDPEALWHQQRDDASSLGKRQRDSPYGPTAIEGLDLYPAKTANAPIFVFVHGGPLARAARGGTTAFPPICSSMPA